jgi:hypothetical protein
MPHVSVRGVLAGHPGRPDRPGRRPVGPKRLRAILGGLVATLLKLLATSITIKPSRILILTPEFLF